MAKNKRIILGVTGSIAAYRSADLLRHFMDKGLEVSVVMTKESEKFITPLTLASLSGKPVYSSMFEGVADSGVMPHISLAKEAACIVIAPATANVIAKLACGLADDLLTCVVLATKSPVVIVPAMNVEMFDNKIVRENCLKLKKFGFKFVEPVDGKLACGDVGQGHIASNENILKCVLSVL